MPVVGKCKYCGKHEDSTQGYLGIGRSTNGTDFAEPYEAWRAELWAATGIDWCPALGPFWQFMLGTQLPWMLSCMAGPELS